MQGKVTTPQYQLKTEVLLFVLKNMGQCQQLIAVPSNPMIIDYHVFYSFFVTLCIEHFRVSVNSKFGKQLMQVGSDNCFNCLLEPISNFIIGVIPQLCAISQVAFTSYAKELYTYYSLTLCQFIYFSHQETKTQFKTGFRYCDKRYLPLCCEFRQANACLRMCSHGRK